MKRKTVLLTTSAFCGALALIQLTRIVFRWNVIAQGVEIPIWFSFVYFIATCFLSYQLYRLSRK